MSPYDDPHVSPGKIADYLHSQSLIKHMQSDEEVYYDLATPEGQAQYREAVEERAEAWAKNFEEPKQGDGDPYELGQGDDLWIDIVERWDDEFDGDAVSDQDAARQLGTEVCEQVIITLVGKR
jgi:hypothetical protein